MESYKKEIAVLHEKNVQSAINEKTSSLQINLQTLIQENVRLNQEVQNNKTDYMKIIIAFVLAIIIGFVLVNVYNEIS